MDGVVHLANYPPFQQANLFGNWAGERGTNFLDGGAPFYDTCQTRDGRFMAVSAPPLLTPFVSLIKEER